MTQVSNFVHAHVVGCFIAFWLFSNAVLYMPPVTPQDSGFYKWLFGFLHAIAGAVPRIASNLLPAGSWAEKLFAGGNGATPPPPQP